MKKGLFVTVKGQRRVSKHVDCCVLQESNRTKVIKVGFDNKNKQTYFAIINAQKIVNSFSTVHLSYVVTVKSTVEILQNFGAFSDYMNFTLRSVEFKNDL